MAPLRDPRFNGESNGHHHYPPLHLMAHRTALRRAHRSLEEGRAHLRDHRTSLGRATAVMRNSYEKAKAEYEKRKLLFGDPGEPYSYQEFNSRAARSRLPLGPG
ncbi:MAG: hypothetical protein HY558_06415 [Euryarchaeota archaeon]|nr:hypothetical protein [Euryarchaeota archaeon]